MMKRPEIGTAEFVKTVEMAAVAVIPHDAKLFGSAANNGQMIAELEPKGKAAQIFVDLASAVSGRRAQAKSRKGFFNALVGTSLRKQGVERSRRVRLTRAVAKKEVGDVRQARKSSARRAAASCGRRDRERGRGARQDADPGGSDGRTQARLLLPDEIADFQRFDRSDRPRRAIQARYRSGARGDSRYRARDRHDQEPRAVHRRAGGPARGHLQ